MPILLCDPSNVVIAAVVSRQLAVLLHQETLFFRKEGVAHAVLRTAGRRLPKVFRPPARPYWFHRFHGRHRLHRLHWVHLVSHPHLCLTLLRSGQTTVGWTWLACRQDMGRQTLFSEERSKRPFSLRYGTFGAVSLSCPGRRNKSLLVVFFRKERFLFLVLRMQFRRKRKCRPAHRRHWPECRGAEVAV